jgi:hypothetical protein
VLDPVDILKPARISSNISTVAWTNKRNALLPYIVGTRRNRGVGWALNAASLAVARIAHSIILSMTQSGLLLCKGKEESNEKV